MDEATTEVKPTLKKKDFTVIWRIVKRGFRMMTPEERNRYRFDELTVQMDIAAVHLNDTPLRLREFLKAPDLDFTHDFFGISKNLNRQTGKLENHFRPRYAERTK